MSKIIIGEGKIGRKVGSKVGRKFGEKFREKFGENLELIAKDKLITIKEMALKKPVIGK